MNLRTLLVALSLAATPALAPAQAPAPADGTANAAEPVRRTSHRAEDAGPAAPAGRSENFIDGVAFDLELSDEEPQASLQLGGFLTRTRPGTEGDPTTQSDIQWSTKLTVPIGGSDDLTAGSTLDALSDGTTFTFDISYFWFASAVQNLRSETFLEYMESAQRNCAREAAEDPDLSAAERDSAMERCHARLPDPVFARRYSDASIAAVNRSLFGGMWRIGAEGSIGFDRFSYIDAATLAEIEEEKVQYSAAAFFTYFPSDAMSAVIGRADYQNAYEAAEEALVCRPVVADPEEDCVNGISGPPSNIERLNFSLEYRRVFDPRWRQGLFAISPRATIDALSGEFEAELPLYYIPRGDSPVSPGLRLSYSTEDDEVVFGIFLRTSFSL